MNEAKFRTCLVTGGCGFIGANLIHRLKAQIPKIRLIDNLSTGKYENIKGCNIEFVESDIRDTELLERCLQDIELVIHLAARPGVIDSVNDPHSDFQINAFATFNLLYLSKKYGVKRFIFASTGGAILGEAIPPIHEDMVARPISPYGASKLAAEAYCSAFRSSYGLETIILRFSNVYGPYSDNKSSVIAQFIKDILADKELTIYGDGKQTRDFLFVEDLVSAILCAINVDKGADIFQIGSGRETSILELLELMKKVSGLPDLKVKFKPARSGEVKRSFSKIDKARKVLDFKPLIDLETGLAKTWEWFRR